MCKNTLIGILCRGWYTCVTVYICEWSAVVRSLYRDVDVQSTATHPPPPGLSFALVSKVTGGNFPAPDQLEKVGADELGIYELVRMIEL